MSIELPKRLLKPDTYRDSMPSNFTLEKRETYGKPYLKVFLFPGLDHSSVTNYLQSLQSVDKANVTTQKSGRIDITVYPGKFYNINELEKEVELNLRAYFQGRSLDPIFPQQIISSISDNAYFQIIDHILALGKNLETFPKVFKEYDEEGYRNYFIPFLNAISKSHAAGAEVFNRYGHSDILITDADDNKVFIAECKVWNGASYLSSGVDQLLEKYVNWRDEKTAIIIFNKEHKNFSDIIQKAIDTISSHSNCEKYIGQRKGTSFSFIFKQPTDPQKKIRLELVLFNFT